MAIYDQINRIKNAKAAIKTAIEGKGVTVGNGTIDTYADKIDQIQQGGDATTIMLVERTGTSVQIPAGTTKIGNYAFYVYPTLTTVTIPDSVTSIGEYAFGTSGLTSVTIPESVHAISQSCFSYCNKLATVSLPDTLTTIAQNAFTGCSVLTALTIPANVTTIGAGALNIGLPTGKATLTMKPATPPTIQPNTIGANVAKIIVPVNALDAYKTAPNWSSHADIIESATPVEMWYVTSVNETDYGTGGQAEFISNTQDFGQFTITEGEGLFYDETQVYYSNPTGWQDENYRVVEFYQTPGESLATWLTNCAVPIVEKWELDEFPSPPVDAEGNPATYNTDFLSNGERFNTIRNDGPLYYGNQLAFGEGQGWSNANYKTLYFITAPTGDLLAWLQTNGTQHYTSADSR